MGSVYPPFPHTLHEPHWETRSRSRHTVDYNTDQQPFGRGVVQVEVLRAEGIRGDRILGFGKASTYLIMKYGHENKQLKSPPHRDAGSTPTWNHSIENVPQIVKACPDGTEYMWVPIFARGKDEDGKTRNVHKGQMLMRFYFEKKGDSYFGNGHHEKDRSFRLENRRVNNAHQARCSWEVSKSSVEFDSDLARSLIRLEL
ncbi:hypothetical protein Mapa_011965 [Marchantia paleacea]|nr:hypothetical protein Mapa_011965 [Marchantia paleacea]